MDVLDGDIFKIARVSNARSLVKLDHDARQHGVFALDPVWMWIESVSVSFAWSFEIMPLDSLRVAVGTEWQIGHPISAAFAAGRRAQLSFASALPIRFGNRVDQYADIFAQRCLGL